MKDKGYLTALDWTVKDSGAKIILQYAECLARGLEDDVPDKVKQIANLLIDMASDTVIEHIEERGKEIEFYAKEGRKILASGGMVHSLSISHQLAMLDTRFRPAHDKLEEICLKYRDILPFGPPSLKGKFKKYPQMWWLD